MKHEITAADELAVLERAMKRKRPRQAEALPRPIRGNPGGVGFPKMRNRQPEVSTAETEEIAKCSVK